MRKSLTALVVIGLIAWVLPSSAAAKGVPYKGKTSGGHKISFKLAKGKAMNVATGVPMTCLAIQGYGAPVTGVEPLSYRWIELGLKNFKFQDFVKPSFHYNEVTRNHTVTLQRSGKRRIRGSIRLQYQFLLPKYPPGTFTIYSCLGKMKFSARPVRR